MTRLRAWFVPTLIPITLVVGLLGVSGCPDNPYKASSWTKKLNTREHERAVQELEALGDPSAIPDLGKAWDEQGKPARDLQVIIALARPLTPAEAKANFVTDYEESGREAHWAAAMPFLTMAIEKVDEASAVSVESATKAAEAIGESKDPAGIDALISIADKAISKKLNDPQIAAIRALGRFDNEKSRAAAALIKIIEREPPQHPRTVKGKDVTDTKELKRAAEEKYSLFLRSSGAAINALGELQIETASKTLILSLYRTPALAAQIRRALVATGPKAKEELRRILTGENKEVNDLFARKSQIYPQGLGFYCGDTGELPKDKCAEVGIKDFYAALVLGDFYDPKTTPDLLAALRKPAAPRDFQDDKAGPTQYVAIFDALKKIGPADAAATVRELWMPVAAKPKAKTAEAAPDLETRILAIGAYAYVARDTTGVEELGKIADDNNADDTLRQAAAETFARLARSTKDIDVLKRLAAKYFEASKKKRVEADAKPKQDADAADKVLAEERKKNDDAKANVLKVSRDTTKGADDIKAASKLAKEAEAKFKVAKAAHRTATQPYKLLDGASKAYKGYARMFQTHIARIETAIRCKDNLECFAAALSLKPEDSANNLKPYIEDLAAWTKDEMLGLLEGNVERAMLEIGKKGAAASKYTNLLLDNAKSDNRLIRQSILLALPKIAALPCAACEAKLDAAIQAGAGKVTLNELTFETTMLRHYFSAGGGKKPAAVEKP